MHTLQPTLVASRPKVSTARVKPKHSWAAFTPASVARTSVWWSSEADTVRVCFACARRWASLCGLQLDWPRRSTLTVPWTLPSSRNGQHSTIRCTLALAAWCRTCPFPRSCAGCPGDWVQRFHGFFSRLHVPSLRSSTNHVVPCLQC